MKKLQIILNIGCVMAFVGSGTAWGSYYCKSSGMAGYSYLYNENGTAWTGASWVANSTPFLYKDADCTAAKNDAIDGNFAKTGNPDPKKSNAATNPNAKGCGAAGGRDCTAANSLNMLAPKMDEMAAQGQAYLTQAAGQKATTQLQQSGMNTTNQQVAGAQASVEKQAAKGEKYIAAADTVTAVAQGYMGYLHQTQGVAKLQAYGTGQAYAIAPTGGGCATNDAACIKTASAQWTSDLTAQKAQVATQLINTGMTGQRAAGHFMQAAAMNAQADSQLAYANTQQFAYNPGSATMNTNGPDLSNLPTTPGAVVANPTDSGGLPGGNPINPGNLDTGDGGPAPNPFVASAPGAGAGAAPAAAALGTSGGTSAAKDDSKGPDGPISKSQTGGTYAKDDTAKPMGFGGGGGGAAAGDGGFGDLLKKMLPGNDDKGPMSKDIAFDEDRMPASDSARVHGRNENIFDAIHKRYEKKSTEGAISLGSDS